MKNKLFFFQKVLLRNYIFVVALLPFPIFGFNPNPFQLRCEYLENPLGIDTPHPRLSWKMSDQQRGAKQSGYRIIVGKDSVDLVKGHGDMWDTGKIASASNFIVYQGKQLEPFTKYFWVVETWTKDGNKTSSAPISSFETGMMQEKNWQGDWISDSRDENEKKVPYFRKVFSLQKKIKSARAYITAGGLFELSINGQEIGDHRLDPNFTRFDRRLLYVTHDVTEQLQSGKNAVGIILGNGWYNHQSTAVWFFDKAPWRNRPTFMMDLQITYEDGSVETISSGNDWKTSLGPISFTSIYTGEHYDARLEQPGWNTINFDDSDWQSSIIRSSPSQKIVSQTFHPIRDVETIIPVAVNKINDTTYVFDLGRNISGVSELNVRGPAGTIFYLKHGEKIYENGTVDMSNIDIHYRPTDDLDPFQTDIFISKGKGEEKFRPRFNYKGFQYVEVTISTPIELKKENLTGYFMHSDVPPVGKISSSNPLIDKIWWATNNSYLSNLFGYPTDCPQREKNGWTGDAHIAIETGLFNFDGITVYEKWMADHRDEQQPNGVLPAIIPTSGWGYDWANGPDWTSSIAIIPWNLYLYYGDTRPLTDNYDNIKQYVDHITETYPKYLTTWGLGDWVPVKTKSNVEMTSSIYYFVDVQILASTAKILGKEEDYKNYKKLSESIRNAINSKFLNKENGIYASGTQTELSMALYWGLVPEEFKKKVAANLADKVVATNFHLDVGLLGTKSLLNALSENGYANLAYKIASQQDYPSWGWWIVNGATTLYENWNIEDLKDVSQNHIMFGEISAWFYKGLGGIKPDPKAPGFKNILLEPHFVDGLENFRASYNSTYGEIVSSWKKYRDRIEYSVTIPANATGSLKLTLPQGKQLHENGKVVTGQTNGINVNKSAGEKIYQLEAGTYYFNIK